MLQKMFNTILMVIFVSLISLYVYKTFNKPNTVSVPIENNTTNKDQNLNSNGSTSNKTSAPNYSKEEIQAIVKEYIMNNPLEIIESVENLHRKRVEDSSKHVSDYIKDNKNMIEQDSILETLGNKKGDVTIVMFYDYNCSYCKKANEYNLQLIKADSNVKIVLRPIPILGEISSYATKVAIAMQKIIGDKFPEFHNELIATKPLSEESVKAIVKKYGVDYNIVQNEMNSIAVKDMVAKNLEIAKNMDIRGAPSYLVNGYYVAGLVDDVKFAEIIKHIKSAAVPLESSEDNDARDSKESTDNSKVLKDQKDTEDKK